MSKHLKLYLLVLIYLAIRLNPLESSSLSNDAPSHVNEVKEHSSSELEKEGAPTSNLRSPSNVVDLRKLSESEQQMLQWSEAWNGHNQLLHLVYLNKRDHVAIYFDYNVGPYDGWKQIGTSYRFWSYHGSAKWLFNFTSRVWDYMTRTYGQFGPDPNLYLVIHPENYIGAHRYYSLNPEGNNMTRNRNILDLSATRKDKKRKFSWYGLNEMQIHMETNLILNQLSIFVEESSKSRLGSPSSNVWRNESSEYTAWTDIFTYDVYMNLSMKNRASQYRTRAIQKMETRGHIMWFKNWFLPIYEDHGGSRVLNEYFMILRENVPHDGVLYNYTLDMGEFIHFWSGAAKTDLKAKAAKAFGWNITYETQYLRARGAFPNVTVLYNVTDSADNIPSVPIPTSGNRSNTVETSAATLANNNKETSMKPVILIIAGSVGSAIIISLTVALLAFYVFYKRKIRTLQTEIRALTNDEMKDFFDGDDQIKNDEAHALIFSSPFINEFEISRDQMIIDQKKVLGEGQFGTVVHGFIRERQNNELVPAAIKTVKPNVDVICFKTFLSEVKIITYLGIHENIVKLLGTCTSNIRNREIFIALEFCSLGNLEEYLKKNRPNFVTYIESSFPGTLGVTDLSTESVIPATIKLSDLFKWAQEISNAMLYLTQKKVIHGDLAARNVLLTENRVVRVSDFGLSRQFLNYAAYMKTSKLPVPWRWLSIEALNDLKFSTASDVWAFGVTLWEIFSLAEIPYGAWTYDLYFVDRLLAGDRLLRPIHANQDLYELMNDCWKIDPANRPTFQHIYNRFGDIMARPLVPNCEGTGPESNKRNTLCSSVTLAEAETEC